MIAKLSKKTIIISIIILGLLFLFAWLLLSLSTDTANQGNYQGAVLAQRISSFCKGYLA